MKQDAVIVTKFHTKSMNKNNDEKYMLLALKEAQKAFNVGEVPVGCIIVKDGIIISKAYNKREKTKSPFDHAEVVAIKKASKKLNSWKLDGCELYVTLEPCLMCASVILQTRISRVIYGADEPKFGALGSIVDLSKIKSNHNLLVTKGILKSSSELLLKDFFKQLRENKQKIVSSQSIIG